MANRDQILKYFSEVEMNQNVYLWKYRDIDVWPILKFILFFTWEQRNSRVVEKTDKLGGKGRGPQIKSLFYSLKSIIKFLFSSRKQVEFLLFGAPHFNIEKDGRFLNKYFYPFKNLIADQNVMEVEYFGKRAVTASDSYDKLYLIDFLLWGIVFRKKVQIVNLYKNNGFLLLINEFSNLSGIHESVYLNAIRLKLTSIETYIPIVRLLFFKIKPKQVRGLCYYNLPMFAVNYYLNKSNIPNMDMQHGGIGIDHPMYNFKHLGQKLNSLPRAFSVWDDITKKYLDSIFGASKEYEVLQEGNFWIEYLKGKNPHKIIKQGKVILYTMQYPKLEDFVLEAIRDLPVDCKWWIRMHPRYNNKEHIIEVLKSEQLLDRVEFELANSLPLPKLLDACDLHVSAFSGSIIEASIMGVPSVIISPIGKRMYSEYIDAKRAVYFDEDSDGLTTIIKKILDGKADISYNARIQ